MVSHTDCIFYGSQKVLEVDTHEAQRLSLLRPLVRRDIEKHFADFGLEPDFVSHNTLRGLSGGRKSRSSLVLPQDVVLTSESCFSMSLPVSIFLFPV